MDNFIGRYTKNEEKKMTNEELFNGIRWTENKCTFDENDKHMSSITIHYDPSDIEAKIFVHAIINRCVEHVEKNPIEYKKLLEHWEDEEE